MGHGYGPKHQPSQGDRFLRDVRCFLTPSFLPRFIVHIRQDSYDRCPSVRHLFQGALHPGFLAYLCIWTGITSRKRKLTMADGIKYQELSDEQLELVVGGHHRSGNSNSITINNSNTSTNTNTNTATSSSTSSATGGSATATGGSVNFRTAVRGRARHHHHH